MTADRTSPFIPGARVAIAGAWHSGGYTEGFVEKVHKTGNFVLRGSKQQWCPHQDSYGERRRWRARATGEGWRRPSLVLWDDETDKEIKEAISLASRQRRLSKLSDELRSAKAEHFTDAMLDQIEAALPKKQEATAA